MLELEQMTVTNLRALAKEHNIKNVSKLNKDELIVVLKQIMPTENSTEKIYEEDKQNEVNKEEKKEIIERQYDENGNPIVDYKLTNEGDAIVEGILDILPDGYGFLRGDNFLI